MVWRRHDFQRLNQPASAHDPKLPKYVRIAAVLRGEILSGRYLHGELLPTEPELAQRFDVARLTVRRALEALALDHLIVRRPGRGHGTRVNLPSISRPDSLSMGGLMTRYREEGTNSRVEIVSTDTVPADEVVADHLQCEPGTQVLRFVRRRFVSGRAFSVFTTHVLSKIGEEFGRDFPPDSPMIKLIEAQGYRITHAEQYITACIADETSGHLLDCSAGDPLINVQRVAMTADNTPIEYISVIYRPTDYNYHISLERDPENDISFWKVRGLI